MDQILFINQYIVATILLALIHGSIPNHWLPFIALSRAEKWSTKKLIMIISIGAIFHSLSTAILGFFISYFGYYISSISQLEKILPTFFMVFLGMIYLIIDHQEHYNDPLKKKSINPIFSVILLYLGMFFSPCLEIEAIYFSVGRYGLTSFVLISLIYTIITLVSMLTFSYLAYKGLLKYFPKILEKYEKRMIGLVLIILGIFSFYFH
jgi:nickel/cobalt exporter